MSSPTITPPIPPHDFTTRCTSYTATAAQAFSPLKSSPITAPSSSTSPTASIALPTTYSPHSSPPTSIPNPPLPSNIPPHPHSSPNPTFPSPLPHSSPNPIHPTPISLPLPLSPLSSGPPCTRAPMCPAPRRSCLTSAPASSNRSGFFFSSLSPSPFISSSIPLLPLFPISLYSPSPSIPHLPLFPFSLYSPSPSPLSKKSPFLLHFSLPLPIFVPSTTIPNQRYV